MSLEKMREEFERTNGRDHRRRPPKGNNYIDQMAQADWESFQKGWMQSRESLVIELPNPSQTLAGPSLYAQFKEAVEAAGVKVEAST